MRLAASVIAAALAVSSCAVGVRGPASELTDTSAVMNGTAVSTTGGPGSYFVKYGFTSTPLWDTPTRDVDFEEGESQPVSEPLDGLEPGTTYHYRVCAEDGENPGDPFCSPDQAFETTGTGVPTFLGKSICTDDFQYSQEGVVVNYEPQTRFGFSVDFSGGLGGSASTAFTTDESGNAAFGGVGAEQRFGFQARIWLNPDGDFVQDPGEETVFEGTYSVDDPCTDAQPVGPTNS
jgi:hypothetical protein